MTDAAITTRQKLQNRLRALETERSSWVPIWEQIARYVAPTGSRFIVTDRNRGKNKYGSIINNRATMALRTLRAGLQSGVCPPDQPWFDLTPQDPELADVKNVQVWLDWVEKTIYRVLSSSNFYTTFGQQAWQLGAFGTGPLSHDDDFDTISRFQAHIAGEYYLANDERGLASIFYRKFQMTVEQMIRKFGKSACSRGVVEAYDKGNLDQWRTVCQAVEPMSERFAGTPIARRWEFVSIYWDPHDGDGKDKLLKIDGYAENPVHTPRWDLDLPDVYGYGCAMDALGDVKQLQLEELRKAQAIDQLANPAMQGPALTNKRLDPRPGAYNEVPTQGQQAPIRRLIEEPGRINELTMDIQDIEQRIDRAFYADLFLMMANSDRRQITAQEIIERRGEKLLAIGPVLTRLNDELLDPLINRIFSKIVAASRPFWPDAGIIPPPPEELAGQDLKIEYTSSLQQAQKAVQAQPLEHWLMTGLQLAAAMPEALDKIDIDESMDQLAELRGVTPRAVRSDEEVQQMRQARAAAQQQAAAQETIATGADAAGKLGRAQMDGTALGALADQLGG